MSVAAGGRALRLRNQPLGPSLQGKTITGGAIRCRFTAISPERTGRFHCRISAILACPEHAFRAAFVTR